MVRWCRCVAVVKTMLVLAHATPDARILTGLKRPLEARIDNRTTPAHRLGLLDLQ